MTAPIIWLLYTSFAIVAMVAYDIALKIASEKINVFYFTAALSLAAFIVHLLAFLWGSSMAVW
jgi:hypothetical protein